MTHCAGEDAPAGSHFSVSASMRNFWTETNADSYREMAGDQFRKKLQMLQKQGVLRKDLPDFSETDPGVEEAKDGGVVAG